MGKALPRHEAEPPREGAEPAQQARRRVNELRAQRHAEIAFAADNAAPALEVEQLAGVIEWRLPALLEMAQEIDLGKREQRNVDDHQCRDPRIGERSVEGVIGARAGALKAEVPEALFFHRIDRRAKLGRAVLAE